MRKKIFLFLSKSFALGIALFLAAVSVFAVQFGIDNDAGWGKGRVILLLTSIIFFLFFLFLQFPIFKIGTTKWYITISKIAKTMPLIQSISRMQESIRKQMNRIQLISILNQSAGGRHTLFALLGIAFAFLTFLAVQHNRVDQFNPTNYFDQLADGFLSGQPSLLEEPSPELIALSDPYHYSNREGISYIWDVSYYQGKYYLYWGMVPALVASVIKWIHPMIVFDHYLVWGFYLGIIVLMALILSTLHKNLFSDQPTWIIMAFTWISGSALPMLWLTTRPSVYETAITASQFFLLFGCFAALQVIWKKNPWGWLILAGFSWGATVNARATLAAPIVWLSLALCCLLYKKYNLKKSMQYLLVLAIPAILWAIAMGNYNALRFGDIFETGHRYQLGGPFFPNPYHHVTSWHYMLPSLYSYLIRPFQLETVYPYISTPFITEFMWPFFIKLPEHYYYPEPTAGILLCVPIILLSFLPILNLIRRFYYWVNETTPVFQNQNQSIYTLLMWMFGFAGIIAFVVLLLFYSTSMRYLADITPILLIYSALAVWGFQKNYSTPYLRRLVSSLTGILLLLSVFIGYLANL